MKRIYGNIGRVSGIGALVVVYQFTPISLSFKYSHNMALMQVKPFSLVYFRISYCLYSAAMLILNSRDNANEPPQGGALLLLPEEQLHKFFFRAPLRTSPPDLKDSVVNCV